MKALVLPKLGGWEDLTVTDVPAPEVIRAGDVRVRVHTAGINHLDLFILGGLPGISYTFPHIVGSDAAGVIESVGSAVTGWKPGDRVMMNPGIGCNACALCAADQQPLCRNYRLLGEHVPGTVGEFVVVPATNLAPVPESMPWAQAAGFSLAALTSWRMLTGRARLRAGETVLIWGIGGGVAQSCLQIAKMIGATAIVTSSSDEKLERARALGADHLLNHARDDVPRAVRALTDGRNADVVVDNVGEATWQQSLRALARGGRLVTCGGTTGPMVTTDVRKLFWYQWDILGSTMGGDREYQEVARHAAEGRLWPVVDSVVPLSEGAEAFRRMADGAQFGKLVIEVAP
ncbi:MAG TPA: zinc-binding dehydrogenase [Gemmatimonadales bacterium]|nr:zinc-binding dehydrogenase [Gemmatimonadales bacterium]